MVGREKVTIDALFNTAVEAIYAATLEPASWPAALQATADLTGDVGAILIFNRDDGTYGVIETDTLKHLLPQYRENWSHRDIRAIRASERNYFFDRDIITDSDVLSDAEIETDPFYADFLAEYGLKYFAAIMVSPDPHVEVAVSVQRRRDRPRYSEGELDALRRLGPHIENALRISIRLMDSELTKLELGEALGRLGIGVFALDSLGRVTFSNTSANNLLGDGIEVVQGRLRVNQSSGVGATSVELVQSLDKVSDMPPRPIMVHRQSSHRPLAVYVLPVHEPRHPGASFLTHVRALLIVVDLEPGEPPDPALVRDLLGLTLGEARVASLVGAGLAPREAAERLKIAEETARSVLKRVFVKTGVSRQSELVALMARLIT